MIEFTLPGIPVPWSRPRFRGKQGFLEPRLKAAKLAVALTARRHLRTPLVGPLRVEATFYCPGPQNVTKARLALFAGEAEPTITKPDLDNLLKTVLDGLNRVAYADDNQVAAIGARKVYSTRPRTVVRIGPL